MRLQNILCCLAFSSLPLMAIAQKMVTDSTTLEPVTITAQIMQQPISKTGRNIQVISGELLKQLPVHSVDEIFRYLPGIEMQMRGPMGAQSDISMRGGTFQQVLVLLDGLRINDPNTGHFNSYLPINVAEIDRIEVLKGSASAIYGTEAVGGVIHIITKAFAQQKQNSFVGELGYGEYGLWKASAYVSKQFGKHNISVGAQTLHTDGQPQRGAQAFVHHSNASLSYGGQLNKNWKMGLRTAWDSRDFSAQNFYTAFVSDTAREKVTSFWNQAQLQFQKGPWQWNISGGYKLLDDRYQYNATTTANKNRSALWQGLSTVSYHSSARTQLLGGVQWINKQISSNDRGNHQLNQLGLFGIWQQQLGNAITFSPALRMAYHEATGWAAVPQLNLSYQHKDFQIRASGGRSLRDADFTERYNNYNKPLVKSGSLGNPELKAESGWSYELGADVLAFDHLRISATGFKRHQNNVIDYVQTDFEKIAHNHNLIEDGLYALASNVARTEVEGFELDLRFSRQMNEQLLQMGAGVMGLQTKVLEGKPGFYLQGHAKWFHNFFVVYSIGKWNLSASGVYKFRMAQTAPAIEAVQRKDYVVINLKTHFDLAPWMRLYAQVDNIGNVAYSDLLGAVMPKRWISGGVQFRL